VLKLELDIADGVGDRHWLSPDILGEEDIGFGEANIESDDELFMAGEGVETPRALAILARR